MLNSATSNAEIVFSADDNKVSILFIISSVIGIFTGILRASIGLSKLSLWLFSYSSINALISVNSLVTTCNSSCELPIKVLTEFKTISLKSVELYLVLQDNYEVGYVYSLDHREWKDETYRKQKDIYIQNKIDDQWVSTYRLYRS